MSNDGKGYLTPDPPDPPDMICVKVFIPNAQLYINAFWGAYWFFTQWSAWARDPLKKGKAAAAVWLRAFNRARAHWDIFQGDCQDMINNLRAKPLEPCVLQALNDEGEWIDIFDASCCGGGGVVCLPQLRVNGGTIEQYNPQTGEWDQAGPPTPPQTTPIIPPAYPPSNDGACLAATNFAALIEARKNRFAEVVGLGFTYGDAFLEAFDLLNIMFGLPFVMSLLTEVMAAIYEQMANVYADVGTYDITDMALCLALPHYANDGSMSQAEVDKMIVEIDALIATFGAFDFEATTWRYVKSWVLAAGPSGMGMAANYMGITEGACSVCPWVETLDFRDSPEGFTIGNFNADPALYNSGVYIPGQGWKTKLMPFFSGPIPQVEIKRLIPQASIDRIEIVYVGVQDGYTMPGDGITAQSVQVVAFWDDGQHTIETTFDPPHVTSELSLSAHARSFGSAFPDASCVIQKVIYHGNGPNPFTPPLPPASEG